MIPFLFLFIYLPFFLFSVSDGIFDDDDFHTGDTTNIGAEDDDVLRQLEEMLAS